MFREPGSSKMSERSASGRDYSGVVGSGLGSLGGPRPEPWFPGLWLRWAPGGRPGGGAGGFRVGGGGGRGARGGRSRAPPPCSARNRLCATAAAAGTTAWAVRGPGHCSASGSCSREAAPRGASRAPGSRVAGKSPLDLCNPGTGAGNWTPAPCNPEPGSNPEPGTGTRPQLRTIPGLGQGTGLQLLATLELGQRPDPNQLLATLGLGQGPDLNSVQTRDWYRDPTPASSLQHRDADLTSVPCNPGTGARDLSPTLVAVWDWSRGSISHPHTITVGAET